MSVKTRVPSAPHEQGMWHTPVTSALGRRRQENRVSLDYMERRAAVKSMGRFSWRPAFHPQYPRGGSQPLMTLVPVDPAPSLAS